MTRGPAVAFVCMAPVRRIFSYGLLLLVLALAGSAYARPRRKTRMAVLEYRSGVGRTLDLASRLVRLLKRKTSYDIVDLTEARKRIGPGVDFLVARCAGRATCMAALGRRLGVDEVLLVAMTQMGDIIVVVSRILTRSRTEAARAGITVSGDQRVPSQRLMDLLNKLLPAAAFKRYGSIRVRCNIQNAQVFVGKELKGQTPLEGPLELPAPAEYEVKVQRKGYVTFTARLRVPPDATITVNANLVPLRTGSPPIHKQWWFWTTLGASAVLVAAGVITGILVGRRNQSQPAAVTVRW